MTAHRSLSLGGLALMIAMGPGPAAFAQENAVCEAAAPLSPTRLLRRLSLDLRGRAPSYDELEAARSLGAVPEGTVEAWLHSDGFLRVMRAHHASLLWPNLDEVELVPQTHLLYPLPRESGVVYVSPLRSAFFRAAGPGNLFEPCEDRPAELDAEGRLVLWPRRVGDTVVAWVDGWVEVRPYWDPSTTVRVCALEALEAERAPACPDDPERYPFLEPTCAGIAATATALGLPFRGADVDCEGPLALLAPGCGCGSDLRRCHTDATLTRLRASFNEQALRIVDQVLREGRPYHEILIEPTIEVNGPIAHYLRHQSRLSLDLFADPDPTAPMASIPLAFSSPEWHPIERSGRHAGVLTAPAYLMRHAAWRQRAHRFYAAFECSSFEPRGPLPSPSDPCSQPLDLTQRCGCADCHQTLEPMAAHWGRFAEFGFMNLTEDRFPAIGLSSVCRAPFESLEQLFLCSRLYEVEPVGEESDYFGHLNAYVFRTAEEVDNIEQGPRKLVEASVASGRFAACAVERMWTRFMHRAPTDVERRDTLPELTRAFIEGGADLRDLVRAIVALPAYGRAP